VAAYGTLVAWARAMGHNEIADLVQKTLDEEKAADEKLSSLAEGGINQAAADATAQTRMRKSQPSVLLRGSRPRPMARLALIGGSGH
jgi:Domain of unknown function (DUF892)